MDLDSDAWSITLTENNISCFFKNLLKVKYNIEKMTMFKHCQKELGICYTFEILFNKKYDFYKIRKILGGFIHLELSKFDFNFLMFQGV